VNVVGSVCTVGEGLDWARLHRPDVILLELKGTETEGTDSADAIASLRAEGYSGVIVLTSYLDETEKTDALGAGARRYLLKEIDSARLVDEIEAVARERRLRFSSPFGSRGLNAGHAC
jgi:DNA-binding NarL/FixJ family response regulator